MPDRHERRNAERRAAAITAAVPDVDHEAWQRLLAFAWTDAAGRSWTATPARPSSPAGAAWWQDLAITCDGAAAGTAKRGISRRADGAIVARHEGLYLGESFQRHGFGGAFVAHTIAGYGPLGVSAVTFVAREDGVLAWAKPGVEFTRPIARDLERNPPLVAMIRAEAGDDLAAVDRCLAEIAAGSLTTPHEIAVYDGGSALLKGLGEWSGRIPM